MKKLGLLLITIAMTLGLFALVAQPALAHHGANPRATCTEAKLDLIGFNSTDVGTGVVVTADSQTVTVPFAAFDANGDATATLTLSTVDVADGQVDIAATWATSSFSKVTIQVGPCPCPPNQTVTQTVTVPVTTTVTQPPSTTTVTTTVPGTTVTQPGTTVTQPETTVTETLPGDTQTITEEVTIIPDKKTVTVTKVIKKNGHTKTITPDKPGDTAFTGPENIVPIAVGILVLLVAGSGMLWFARRRHDAA